VPSCNRGKGSSAVESAAARGPILALWLFLRKRTISAIFAFLRARQLSARQHLSFLAISDRLEDAGHLNERGQSFNAQACVPIEGAHRVSKAERTGLRPRTAEGRQLDGASPSGRDQKLVLVEKDLRCSIGGTVVSPLQTVELVAGPKHVIPK
jgi:hypothetical protein